MCSIRDRRRAAGLTQRQLATAAGIGVGVVRDLEQGVTRHPRRQSLLLLASALGMDSREITALMPADDQARADFPAIPAALTRLLTDGILATPQMLANPRTLADPLALADPRTLADPLALADPRTDLPETEALWCGILGPLEILGPDGAVQLSGPRQQAVLGLLAMQPNAVVDRGSIVDALWGDEPPSSAVTMIHSYVSQLRKLLPFGRDGTGTGLVTAGSGYRLCIRDDELDLLVFARRADRARQARDGGKFSAAFELFEEALVLWRGEPLAGMELLQGHPAVTELRAMRTAAVVDYAEAARSRTEHEKAVPHLRALAGREPLNERAHACLMSALAASGQQAAALEVFGQIRQRLDDQLGVLPGVELAAAQLRVLRGEHAGTAAAPGHPADQPAPDQAPPPPCQLPAAVPDFTGRAAEVSQLVRILAPGASVGVPVAAICGLPGAGKTALALRAAHQLRPQFPDGQLWIQLDGASARPRQPADVLGEVLRTLGIHGAAIPDSLAEKAAMYRSLVADRKILLVADDAASADQVRPLIPGTAGSAVIVTSRTQLTELQGARVMPLDLLGPQEAIGLLARIVGQERVSASPKDAAQLVSACGHLPLAVRIAGAKLAGRPAWPVSLMSEALADQRRRLDELEAGSLSVRASLAMSYQTLDDRSQRALCFLGMLGPTDVAEWVIAALLGVADASDVVNRLADSSLLTPVGADATGFPRYRLHDLLRDYAVERLAEEHESGRGAALARALGAWLQLACVADSGLAREPYFPPPSDGDAPGSVPQALARRLTADPIAWFTAERLNLLNAVEHSCATGSYRLAARLAARVAGYQHIQSRADDTDRMWRAVLAAAEDADDPAAVARAELRIAATLCDRGRHADCVAVIDRCVRAFEEHGDQHALATALYWRAVCDIDLGAMAEGRQRAKRALAVARRLEDRQAQFLALRIVAMSHALLPAYRDQAISWCAEALAIVREFGQPTWELEVMHTVAHVNNLTGRHQVAADMYLEAFELHRKLGVVVDKAGWLGILGDSRLGMGRYRQGAEALSMALPIFRDNFQYRHQALCLLKLGYAYQGMGDYAAAIASIEASLPIFRELRLAHYEERALQTLDSCRRQLPLRDLRVPSLSRADQAAV